MTTYEDQKAMAIDGLNAIDRGANSTSCYRHAMDLMSNYGFKTYREACEHVFERYTAQPHCYGGDTPNRYTNMSRMWEEYQLRNSPSMKAIDNIMSHAIGFEPTGGCE